jgi:hypothetical protein
VSFGTAVDSTNHRHDSGFLVESIVFIVVLVVGIFVFDLGRRWWRENEWQRRWRDRDDE